MGRGKRAAASSAGGPSTSKKAKSDSGAQTGEAAKSVKRTVVVKGASVVDEHCPLQHTAHVYSDAGGPYDAMLNQTNISRNNNKYYILQLLEHDTGKQYSVWFRWGRVGNKGQSSLSNFAGDLSAAKMCFAAKFHDKTRNEWADRADFDKVDGKYDLIQLDHGAREANGSPPPTSADGDTPEDALARSPAKCELDERVRRLLELICDVNAMRQAMVELQYDADKLPLGKLTPAQIKAGFVALKAIEQLVDKGARHGAKLTQACNEYYTRIPHVFGMRTPPLIASAEQLCAEVALCQALADVEVAMRTLRHSTEQEGDTVRRHPADRCYEAMRCRLEPVARLQHDFKAIEAAVGGTHGPTHGGYTLHVLNVFAAQRHDEPAADDLERMDNRRLLWHGSRLTNWYGILCEGLRVAPAHVPITGHMFGRGVYFADVCTKSANYCFANQQKDRALLALCEVALGSANELLAADHKADSLPADCDSTKGLGVYVPDAKGDVQLAGGATLATGPLVECDVHNEDGYTLQYNEFVVYDARRVKLRYLVEVQFRF